MSFPSHSALVAQERALSGASVKNSVAPRKVTSSRYTRRKESGATLVEMAFITILLLTILYGIMGFGHALYAYHFVNNAAKEGARWASVNGSACISDGSCTSSATPSSISTYVQGLVPVGITAGNVVTTAAWPVQTNSPTICSAAVNGQGPTNNYPGCTVSVNVAYAFQFIFPLLPANTSTTAPCTQPGLCMSSTSQMVIIH